MADRLQLALELVNGVSAQSKKIRSDLQAVSLEAKKLQAQLGMKGLDSKFVNSYMKGIIRDIKTANGELKQPNDGKWRASAVAFGTIIRDALESAARSFISNIKDAFDLIGQAEQTEIGLKYQAPYSHEYVKQDVGAYSGITGMGQEGIKQQLLPLMQSLGNIADADTIARQLREASSDLSVMLGHGTKDTEQFIDTFERINLREGLQSRQLMRMNIKESEFYDLLGKNMGLTADAAKKLASQGKLDPAGIRNTLLQMIAKKEGGTTGTATKEYAESFEGRIEKLKAIPTDMLAALRGSPAWKMISDQLGGLYKQLDPNGPNGKRIIAMLGSTLSSIAIKLQQAFTAENIEKWLGYLDKAFGALGFVIDHAETIFKVFRDIGIVMAAIKISGWVDAAVTALPALGTALGGVLGVAGALVAPFLAVAAAVGAIVTAYVRIKQTIDELGGWDRVKKDFGDWLHGDKPAISKGGLGPPKKTAIHFDNPEAERQYKAEGQKLNQAEGKFAGGAVGFGDTRNPRLNTPQQTAANSKQNNVSIQAPISISVEGSTGDDNHSYQEMGQKIVDHMSRALEQSVNQMGR